MEDRILPLVIWRPKHNLKDQGSGWAESMGVIA